MSMCLISTGHGTYLPAQKSVLHQGWCETNALCNQFGPINLWGAAQEAFVLNAVEPRICSNYYYYIIRPNNSAQPEFGSPFALLIVSLFLFLMLYLMKLFYFFCLFLFLLILS